MSQRMKTIGNVMSQTGRRLHLLALSFVLLSVFQTSMAGSLINDYEKWLSGESEKELTLEKNSFDRGLLKLNCSEKINFEFTNKNRRQVKASCGEKWRRFLKIPKQIVELVAPKNISQPGEERGKAFAFKKNLQKGYLLNPKDLDLVERNRFIPSNAISNPENYKSLYLQRDVVKGDLLLKNDLKKAINVFVAKKALPAGIQIDESNFVLKQMTHGAPSDYLKKLSGLEYMTTNKRLDVGKVLRERDLRKAKLVRRNEPVNLIYKTESFSIDAKGVALVDGYFGNRIKAKNLESSLIVSGVVVDYGTISIK